MQQIKFENELSKYSNGCLDIYKNKEESDLNEFYLYYIINILSNEEDNYAKNDLDEKSKDQSECIRNEVSEESKETQLNNNNKLNSFNDIYSQKEKNEFSNSQTSLDKMENEDYNLDNIPKIQNNKPKKKFPENKPLQEGISSNTTNGNFSSLGGKDYTPKKFEDELKRNDNKISVEQRNVIKEDEEIKSVTDNGSEEDSEFEIDEEENEMDDNDMNLEEDKKKDNSRKEALKAPIPLIKQIIEKIMDVKLEDVNLNDLLGSVVQNKIILNWKIYQIFCSSKKNRIKLRDIEPSNEKDKKIFYFLLTRKYKFLFRNYYKKNKSFVINGENIIIEKFPILKEILEEREKKLNKKGNIKQKINNFIQASKSAYMNFRDVKGRKNKCKKLKKVILTKFEEYIDNEVKK